MKIHVCGVLAGMLVITASGGCPSGAQRTPSVPSAQGPAANSPASAGHAASAPATGGEDPSAPAETAPATPHGAAGPTSLPEDPPGGCRGGEREIGERWQEACNTCWCRSDGKVVCTRKACKPDPTPAQPHQDSPDP